MKSRIVATLLAGLGMAALPAAAQAAVTAAEWPLAGNANDTSGNGHNGTANASVNFTADGAEFNGLDSRITVPYSAGLSPGASDVTVSLEVKTTATPGTGDLDFDLVRASPGGKMFKVELFPHGKVKAQAQCIFIGTTTRITVHAGPTLNDGNWHPIVCHKTANQVTLTVNGVQVGSANVTIGSINLKKNGPFALGYKPVPGGTDGDFYNGFMKNVSVVFGS
jgi:Concanavalin A-like lectin/glucanases superfamily